MIEVNETYPKVSIITVVFNGAKALEQTILSVVNQTYKNIEYIIIDGGSTDGTIDIIKKYEDRIAYWVSEPDKGIYDAMNKGIDVATGDYIYFLGDDDCLTENEIIKKVASYLKKDQNIDLLSGKVWIVDEKLKLQKEYTNKFNDDDLYNGYCIPHQGIFLKSSILKKYKFNIYYKIVADYDLFLNLYFNLSPIFKFIDEKIAYYADSGISSINVNERILEDIKVMQHYGIDQSHIKSYEIKEQGGLLKEAKNILKVLMAKIGVIKFIRILKGWEKHSCLQKKCRWCGR